MKRIAKLVIFDTFLSFLWVFCTSSMGAGAATVAKVLDYEGDRTGIIVAEVVVLLLSFSIMGKALGGASWNPTSPVAFYAAGASKDSLFTLAIRLPAMAVGAAAGALAISEVMPDQFKHTLGGPKLKVDLHTGAVAEGVLTFLITLVVLWTVLRGPSNGLLKTLIITVATLFLVAKGGPYTGPAMNPSNAFGWAYVNQNHYSQEHLYVYWVTPFIGALGASAVYRILFAPKAPKEKAA